MSEPRFAFYEFVRVKSVAQSHAERGVVLGRAEHEDGTSWSYAVLNQFSGETTSYGEHELESTGEIGQREDFFRGKVLRVRIDEHGAGRIVQGD